MQQFWLLVGSERNWQVAFEHNNIWGVKDFRELRSLWSMLREGDGLLFYVSKPVHGIVGCGRVATKFKQTEPLWPEEIKRNEVLWPLRFEFDVEYCLPPSHWRSGRYTSHDLQMITRMVFQCYPIEEANVARKALGLASATTEPSQQFVRQDLPVEVAAVSHAEAKAFLVEIGRIQNFIAEDEYPMDSTRLDVVWRRVLRSVPTFVFEVQVGGDVYHAMAKLKHAFDLWNSHIFLVSTLADKGKYDELLAGTFHEVADQMRFLDITMVKELLHRKRSYKEMELSMGILQR